MKIGLRIGDLPDAFKGLATEIGWINLDVSLPKKGYSRRILGSSNNDKDPFEKALSVFVYSFLLFLLPLSLLHLCFQHLMRRGQKKVRGIVLFPQIELTIAMLLVIPYTKASAALLSLGTARGILAGLGMLLAIPIPMLFLSIYAVRRYIVKHRVIKYVVFQHRKPLPNLSIVGFLRTGIFASEQKGYWKGKEHKIMDMYNVFFRSIRGPTYTFKDRFVCYDENNNRYRWGSVVRVPDSMMYARTYYKAYFVARMILLSMLLCLFPDSPRGNIAQPALLVAMLAVHVHFMMFVSPFHSAKDQFTDVSSNLCELGTYVSGLCLLVSRRLYFKRTVWMMERSLLIFQIISIGIQVVAQLWNVFVLLQIIRGIIISRFYKDQSIRDAHKTFLMKKYGNRWLSRVHLRSILVCEPFANKSI